MAGLAITRPLQYSPAMQSEITASAVGATGLTPAAVVEGPATAAASSSSNHGRFSSHMRKLEVLLKEVPDAQDPAQEFVDLLASAPDPLTGQPYPAAMVEAYKVFLTSICSGHGPMVLIQSFWLPAAIAQNVIRESASSDRMREVLLGDGALDEDVLR